jgi:hypothetical protein
VIGRTCRECGCSQLNACVNDATGETCGWAESDLCTACVPGADPNWAHPRTRRPNAVVSACGTYRYALWRDLPAQGVLEDGSPTSATARLTFEDTCLFVMLNPSTADAEQDDPTIRRCVGFARDLGAGRLAVANLYAYRGPDPYELLGVDDPIGPDNDFWITELSKEAAAIIVAWGASVAAKPDRVRQVLGILEDHLTVLCLGTTGEGHPRHPLYVRADTELVAFEATREAAAR